MLRIIAGSARGRKLEVPGGDRVRPTTDRVRESLFNVLAHRIGVRWDGLRVLDLFAGAGSLGIEALSRGAERATFVEKDARVAKVLARNLAPFGEAAVLRRAPVARFLAGPPSAHDVIFLDPPYALGAVAPTLEALGAGREAAGSWLAPDGLVIVEQPAGAGLDAPPHLTATFQRDYGGTTIAILTRGGEP